jgi:hypothetical protein
MSGSPRQAQPGYYDTDYPRRSSNEDRATGNVAPSLLRTSHFTSSSQPNPYARYTDRPGGESSSNTAIEPTDNFTTLPPILGADQSRHHDRIAHAKHTNSIAPEQRGIRDPNGKCKQIKY